jgi:hypothetical protein
MARQNQKLIYDLLFQTSAAALQELAADPRFIGSQIGCLGVLQTWTRDLHYHPHVHYLVPGGGLSADGQTWLRARTAFFVHVKPLSRLFRAKFRAALRQAGLLEQVPTQVWGQEWVVHCQPVGSGQAALKYLATYIFRVALSNHRILKLQEGQVTFRYRESDTRRWKTATLPAEEFIRRFLQHLLPKGFQKVRYYGFFSPSQRHRLHQVRALLKVSSPTLTPNSHQPQTNPLPDPPASLVLPVVGPCAAPRPCALNIVAPPNGLDKAQPNSFPFQTVSPRSRPTYPFALSPEKAASLTATSLFPTDLYPLIGLIFRFTPVQFDPFRL